MTSLEVKILMFRKKDSRQESYYLYCGIDASMEIIKGWVTDAIDLRVVNSKKNIPFDVEIHKAISENGFYVSSANLKITEGK